MGKKQLRDLENTLDGVQCSIALHRKGLAEHLIPHGFAIAREKLAAAQRDVEALGLYEQCRDALVKAEELVKLGPEHDEEAEMLVLNTSRALTAVSGAHADMSKKLREKPNATLDDFKPSPDA